jgi:RHS repeat-associated protein
VEEVGCRTQASSASHQKLTPWKGLVPLSGTGKYPFFRELLGQPSRRDFSGNVCYYWGDHLGTTRIVTDASGNICYDADYYPFQGERTPYVSTCTPAYKMAAMKFDPESGDYYTLNRSYPPNLGRWMSPDPLGGDITNPQSLNRYAYVLNNPATLTDPSGMCAGCKKYMPASNDPFGDAGWTSLQIVSMALTPTLVVVAFPDEFPEAPYGLTGMAFFIYGNWGALDLMSLLGGGQAFPTSATGTSLHVRTKTRCVGDTRALAGNPNLVGKQGGVPLTKVTAGSVAVIPSQWGGITPLSLFSDQIAGLIAVPRLHGLVAFNGVTDTIGSTVVPNVQERLQGRFPADLILELNSLPKEDDPWVTLAIVSVPDPMACPAGTTAF